MDLQQDPMFRSYVNACTFPGQLDGEAVETALNQYLAALNIQRTVQRIPRGWVLSELPSLKRTVEAIIDDFGTRMSKQELLPVSAETPLSTAEAIDAMNRFASWCLHRGLWWWWRWDLSWLSSLWFGARELKKSDVERWTRPLLDAFVAGAWFICWTDDTLYWVAKPTLHRDDQGRLHHETGAAVESDSEDMYFWHGVFVPAHVVLQPETITVTHIQTESNTEVRRVLVERYGFDRYIADSGAIPVHADERGTLYRCEMEGDEPLVMVRVQNSTPEATGDSKYYTLRVPPTMTTATEAVAWTFAKTPKNYRPEIET